MEAETSQYTGAEDNNLDNMVKYMESIGFNYINHANTHDPTFVNKKFQDIASTIYKSI